LLHLFLFLSEPCPAAQVQEALRQAAAAIGIGGSEIFPKQVSLDPASVGNWIAMPYLGTTFDGKLKDQVGIKKTGAEMTFGEFLTRAEKSRQTPEQVAKLARKTERRERPRAPQGRMNAGGVEASGAEVAPFADWATVFGTVGRERRRFHQPKQHALPCRCLLQEGIARKLGGACRAGKPGTYEAPITGGGGRWPPEVVAEEAIRVSLHTRADVLTLQPRPLPHTDVRSRWVVREIPGHSRTAKGDLYSAEVDRQG